MLKLNQKSKFGKLVRLDDFDSVVYNIDHTEHRIVDFGTLCFAVDFVNLNTEDVIDDVGVGQGAIRGLAGDAVNIVKFFNLFATQYLEFFRSLDQVRTSKELFNFLVQTRVDFIQCRFFAERVVDVIKRLLYEIDVIFFARAIQHHPDSRHRESIF